MRSTISDRVELAKLCSYRDWSKAIRILDSLLSQSCAIQDICNRAFCYSQLELHKHVIKDCDKALQLDPKLLQAYILKGSFEGIIGLRVKLHASVKRISSCWNKWFCLDCSLLPIWRSRRASHKVCRWIGKSF